MQYVGHRGDPRHAPENTLASLEMAWRHGRRAIECDIRATRDGVPIMFHDAGFSRVTDGEGVVARRLWRNCRRLDAGAWFHARFTGERIASVEQVLTVFRRRPMTLFLELKVAGVERRLHRLIAEAGMAHRCRIASYHLRALGPLRRLTPRLSLYRVTGFTQPITPRIIHHARRMGLRGLLAFKRWVTPAVVRRLTAEGLELYVWTVRTAAEEQKYLAMGVTGVMTERCPR